MSHGLIVHGKIILKSVFREQDIRMWTGFNWHRTESMVMSLSLKAGYFLTS
jgi:hypothetical protein